jgi:hypothetical protein
MIRLGLLARPPRAGAFAARSAETTTLLARFSTAPSRGRKAQIDSLITGLKDAGVWTKMDVLWVLAAHDAQAASLNWKSTSFTITDPGTTAPTFAADKGYTGDGTTDYLSTNYNPSTAGLGLVQDNASIGAWCSTNVASTGQFDCGNINLRICGRGGAGSTIRINGTTGVAAVLAPVTSVGLHVGRRDNSANIQARHNAGAVATAVAASSAVSNLPFFLLAQCQSGTTPLNFSTRRVSAVFAGVSLTDAEIAACYTNFERYMTAVGATL